MYNQQDSRLQLAIPDTTATVFERGSTLQASTPSSTTTAVFDGDPTLNVGTLSSTTTLVSYGEACEKSTPDAQPSIPPADHGKDAWLFLAACFFVDALAWGV